MLLGLGLSIYPRSLL
ncbi:hypothetical protein F383_30105 [Gossypium arboreum]|uniref:Uncharacterized protein n=1 Tax=Gossypium arboreum TaxID=29729 RepID=A0A0B0PHR5_GOSAR|nr:hypothetical protein F383_30105 [Gossypium arboreum]